VRFINICRKFRPDIVHSHTPKAGLVAMIGARIANVPVRLHTVAGLPLMETTGFKRAVLEFVEKLTYSAATQVYSNSYKLEEFILSRKFCDENKIKVIGNGSSNGIDVEYFKVNDEVLRKANEIGRNNRISHSTFN